jgi:2-oxo-hept-3-ene-1,7-dioate hydratase
MPLNAEQVADAARRLDQAEKSRQPIRQLSLEHPGMTVADAYQVQRAWVGLKLKAGCRVVGHKIGLTSRAMQQSSQIDEPDHGVLLDDMVAAEGADIPRNRFIEPRIEVELAFVLAKPLRGTACTIMQVLAATEYVVPALEIIDARIQRIDPQTKTPRRVMDTISDNAANAAIVMGGRPRRTEETDLRWVSALCYRNGVIEESGVAAAVLNHPANGIAWLARKLAAYGEGLEAGQVVLAGSFTRPVPIESGDVFHVEYSTFGSIACRFV